MEIIDYLKAVNGTSANYYTLWPVKKPRAIVQIITGMSDYIDRYDHFAHFLNQQNILVIGHDHFGQGKAVLKRNDLGNLIPQTQISTPTPEIVTRSKNVSLACRQFYPEIPLIILGHSLGSLVVTELLKEDHELYQAAILIGIINLLSVAKLFAPAIKSFQSLESTRLTRELNQKAYNVFNQDFQSGEKFGWVTNNPMVRKQLELDPLVGYDYTLAS